MVSSRQWLMIWFCLVLAAFCHVVFMHVAGGMIQMIPDWHSAHLNNTAPAPLQFRWLSYYIPEVLNEFGFGIDQAYLLVRFFSLSFSFFIVARIAAKLTADRLAPFFSISLVALYYAASTQAHMQPSEEINLLLFSLLILYVLDGSKILPLAVIMALGSLNKDTIGFLIPFVFMVGVFVRHTPVKTVIECTILSIVFLVIYWGVRLYFGTDREYLGGLWQYQYNIEYLHYNLIMGSMWLIPSLVPAALIAYRWKEADALVKCFLPTVILFTLGHLLISRIDEFRTYSALAAFMFPAMIGLLLDGEPETAGKRDGNGKEAGVFR